MHELVMELTIGQVMITPGCAISAHQCCSRDFCSPRP